MMINKNHMNENALKRYRSYINSLRNLLNA